MTGCSSSRIHTQGLHIISQHGAVGSAVYLTVFPTFASERVAANRGNCGRWKKFIPSPLGFCSCRGREVWGGVTAILLSLLSPVSNREASLLLLLGAGGLAGQAVPMRKP